MAKKAFLFIFFNALIFIWATYFSWGGGCCNSDDPPSSPNYVTTCLGLHDMNSQTNLTAPALPGGGYTSLEKKCCIPSDGKSPYSEMNSAILADPTQCVSCFGQAKCAGPLQAQGTGAVNAGNAEAANNQASLLGSSAAVLNPGVSTPQSPKLNASVGATAGNTVSTQDPSLNGAGSGLIKAQASGTPGRNQGNGGGGGSGSSGGGSSGLGGGLTPNPGLSSSAPSASDLGMFGSSYSSGGGNGLQSSTRDQSRLLNNLNGGVPSAGSPSSQVFNTQSQGSAGEGGSQDPSDYFTRISIHSSLFKIIHDRYVTRFK